MGIDDERERERERERESKWIPCYKLDDDDDDDMYKLLSLNL